MVPIAATRATRKKLSLPHPPPPPTPSTWGKISSCSSSKTSNCNPPSNSFDFGEGYTDKEENQMFFIYKEIQNGAVAKSYMTNGLLIYG
jgi:hypothetical protein